MNGVKSIILVIVTITLTGCTGKFSPFSDVNYYDAVFGYPPKKLAGFLHIEDQLTVDPADLNKEKPRY